MIYKSSNCLTQTYFSNSIYVIGEQNIELARVLLYGYSVSFLNRTYYLFFILHNVYSSIHLLHCKIVKSRKYATLFFCSVSDKSTRIKMQHVTNTARDCRLNFCRLRAKNSLCIMQKTDLC